MEIYNAGEVFQMAVRIEENGEELYKYLAESIDYPKAKEVFKMLGSEETKHKEYFRKVFENIKSFESWQFPEEYYDYVRILADNLVLSKDKFKKEVESLISPINAINFAIRRELDTILYYNEMKKMVIEKDRTIIDEIIAEEESHFLRLNKLKSEF